MIIGKMGRIEKGRQRSKRIKVLFAYYIHRIGGLTQLFDLVPQKTKAKCYIRTKMAVVLMKFRLDGPF